MNNRNKIIMTLPVLALCSCASIVSKSDYPVTLQSSTPTKVTVKSKGTNNVVHSGVTPTTVTLPASEGYFQPAQYDIQTPKNTQSLNATMDPWYAGNIVFGGIIGALVDPATGAMWKLPKEVNINQ